MRAGARLEGVTMGAGGRDVRPWRVPGVGMTRFPGWTARPEASPRPGRVGMVVLVTEAGVLFFPLGALETAEGVFRVGLEPSIFLALDRAAGDLKAGGDFV